MVKRNEFKKHSRYLAVVMALSMAFSNIGAGVNLVYAAEEQVDAADNADSGKDAGDNENDDSKDNSGRDDESGKDSESEKDGGSDNQESADKGSEDKGSADKESEDKESGDKESDGKDSEDKGSEGKDSDGKDSKEEADSEKDAADQEDTETDKKDADKKDIDEKDADGKQTDEKESGGKDTEEKGENSENGTVNDGENAADIENKTAAGGTGHGGAQAGANGAAPEGTAAGTEVTEVEQQSETYQLTYETDLEDSAVVKGPSSIKSDETAFFTVKAKEGYVIRDVYSLAADISEADEVETASASNAQEKSEENDGKHFQTYQIEDVTDDAEIIIEMEAEAQVPAAAESTVTPKMSQEEIDAAVERAAASESKILEIQAGDYANGSNSHKKVVIDADGMTVRLLGGEYTRAQIITREDTTVELAGDVTFDGQASSTGNKAAAFFVENGTLTFDTNKHTITVSDYANGIRVGNVKENASGDAEFHLEGDGTFSIEASVKPTGAYESDDGYEPGDGVGGCGIALMASPEYQRLLIVESATLKSCKNYGHGIYRHNIDDVAQYNRDMGAVQFKDARVYLDHNLGALSDGFYDEGNSTEPDTYILEVIDSYLSISDNEYNGYHFAGTGARAGRNYRFVDSEIHMDRNGNTNAGFASQTAILDHTLFTANDSKDSIGIMQIGGLKMINGSEIRANNNPYGGVWIEYDSEISDSKITANGNGAKSKKPCYTAGIYMALGELSITNSVLKLKDNPSALTIASPTKDSVKQYGHNVIAAESVYYDTAAEAGNRFADWKRNSELDQFFGRDYVLGGSFQAVTAQMRYGDNLKGMQFTQLNPVIGSEELADGENYAAPINTSHTALTRFDLHQSSNQEVASDENEFTYFDPHDGAQYDYSFRYNTSAEDLTGTGGNAYVWAPVSVLHYDAAQGSISSFGTAQQGNVALMNTRGDGSAVGNAGNAAEASSRYATDYTIFGNSMNLTEGELPEAARAGYKFAGWYVADDEQAAKQYAAAGNWDALNSLLNTRFTADSKVSADITDEAKGQEEKTIYAKWVLPNHYNIVINYVDERTGAHIQASYNSEYLEEGSSYDVDELLRQAISGYTWIRFEGGAAAGSLDGDLVFNVYYSRNSSSSNRGGGSGGGGSSRSTGSTTGSSSGNAGPGVTIPDEAVPLAEIPEIPDPDGLATIPDEDVPLAALPKTGQNSRNELTLLISALLLGAAGIFRKKQKEEQ